MPLLPTTLTVALSAGESNTFGAVTVANESFIHQTQSSSVPLTNGTGTGQATHPVEVTGNATTGGVAIDLTAIGVGTGLDGKNRDFSNGGSGGSIKTFLLENLDATNTITVSQASNGWTGISGAATGLNKVIQPGGHILIHDPVGMAVSSTNKGLVLTANANTPLYKLSIVGVAA